VVSAEAEVLGFRRAIEGSRASGVPLIMRQVTTAAGLDVLRRAKREEMGPPLWVEVNVHHLFLTDEDLARLGSSPTANTLPPSAAARLGPGKVR
jgi:dihydroorotase-like cyclic amidohydrolase